MFAAEVKSEIQPFETKYPCIVCFERVSRPVSCLRCEQVMCHNHVKKIHNRCPYCRLEPFEYKIDQFLDKLAKVDQKKEEDHLISTATFDCLVPGCDFKGKYHQMDLHRRRQHRNQNLREIIFPSEREEANRKRAILAMFKKIQDKSKEIQTIRKMAMVLHKKGNRRIPLVLIQEMIRHIWACGHGDCKKIFIQETMSFIGKEGKEISSCPQAQHLMRFY